MRTLLTFFVFVFSFINLSAQGRIIIPHPPRPIYKNQVYLKYVDAHVQLNKGVGNITLEQSFFNKANVQLEGQYLFPVPREAQLYDFYLYINGKKTRGELLDGKEAREIYESIIRTVRDPALLEYANNGLFKARIFPIPPKSERKIELSYAQLLEKDADTYTFTLPIRQIGQGSIDSYHLEIELETEATLANIYSPSHEIDITRQGDKKAKISFEAKNLEADKDFVLYYSLSEREIPATFLSFRPRTDRDGYFMLLASPRFEVRKKRPVAKDVIFVVDVSGSMAGEKIEQAREALRYCVNTLNRNDRFEIISFSSGIEQFQNGLKKADRDEKNNASYFIDNLSASGGTNINEALQKALSLKEGKDNRPTSIVFLTDGLPTEGEKDIKNILANLMKQDKAFMKIFNFGVGYDVNTFLLDKLARDSHGSVNYVKPGENIEKKVSSFFDKISSPVLTNTEIDFGDLRVYDIYPKDFPDIFRGERITLFGRYRTDGKSKVVLTGEQGGRDRSFKYDVDLPRRNSDNEFIAKLWANRKVSFLLAKIRFEGENEELVQSIKELGKEFGIVTPYTSYLVREQERELAQFRIDLERGRSTPIALRMQAMEEARKESAIIDVESVGSKGYYDALTFVAPAPSASSGKRSVLASRAMQKIALAETETNMILTIKRVLDRTFQLKNGVWIENGLEDQEPDRIIEFLSDDYFEFSKSGEILNRILALGEEVMFRWNGKVYQIKS